MEISRRQRRAGTPFCHLFCKAKKAHFPIRAPSSTKHPTRFLCSLLMCMRHRPSALWLPGSRQAVTALALLLPALKGARTVLAAFAQALQFPLVHRPCAGGVRACALPACPPRAALSLRRQGLGLRVFCCGFRLGLEVFVRNDVPL